MLLTVGSHITTAVSNHRLRRCAGFNLQGNEALLALLTLASTDIVFVFINGSNGHIFR